MYCQRRIGTSRYTGGAYSAAVCESSDLCEMLSLRVLVRAATSTAAPSDAPFGCSEGSIVE